MGSDRVCAATGKTRVLSMREASGEGNEPGTVAARFLTDSDRAPAVATQKGSPQDGS